MRVAEPFDNCCFPNPRLAQQQRVVLSPPAENLNHPLDFLLAPDQRVKAALGSDHHQVTRVLGHVRGRLGRCLGLELAAAPYDFLAKLEELEPTGVQVLGSGRSLDPQKTEYQVVRTGVGVAHALRLVDRKC